MVEVGYVNAAAGESIRFVLLAKQNARLNAARFCDGHRIGRTNSAAWRFRAVLLYFYRLLQLEAERAL